ncbi:hypothetical protein LINPERPRIM_LOCUS23672, partial [Linum perenne]
CNSDRSGEFPTGSSQSRRLLVSCVADNSDELMLQLVSSLMAISGDLSVSATLASYPKHPLRSSASSASIPKKPLSVSCGENSGLRNV